MQAAAPPVASACPAGVSNRPLVYSESPRRGPLQLRDGLVAAPSARRARQRLCSGRTWALSLAARRLALAVRGLGVVSGRPRGARGTVLMVFINRGWG